MPFSKVDLVSIIAWSYICKKEVIAIMPDKTSFLRCGLCPELMKTEKEVRSEHLRFAESRSGEKTYCPSEVARKLWPEEWRDYMDFVRQVADELVSEGYLEVLQQGIIIDASPSDASGPIRLRKKR